MGRESVLASPLSTPPSACPSSLSTLIHEFRESRIKPASGTVTLARGSFSVGGILGAASSVAYVSADRTTVLKLVSNEHASEIPPEVFFDLEVAKTDFLRSRGFRLPQILEGPTRLSDRHAILVKEYVEGVTGAEIPEFQLHYPELDMSDFTQPHTLLEQANRHLTYFRSRTAHARFTPRFQRLFPKPEMVPHRIDARPNNLLFTAPYGWMIHDP